MNSSDFFRNSTTIIRLYFFSRFFFVLSFLFPRSFFSNFFCFNKRKTNKTGIFHYFIIITTAAADKQIYEANEPSSWKFSFLLEYLNINTQFADIILPLGFSPKNFYLKKKLHLVFFIIVYRYSFTRSLLLILLIYNFAFFLSLVRSRFSFSRFSICSILNCYFFMCVYTGACVSFFFCKIIFSF